MKYAIAQNVNCKGIYDDEYYNETFVIIETGLFSDKISAQNKCDEMNLKARTSLESFGKTMVEDEYTVVEMNEV